MRTHVHTNIRTHEDTYTRTHVHTYTRTHVHTYIRTREHRNTRTHEHTNTRTHEHTYTLTYILRVPIMTNTHALFSCIGWKTCRRILRCVLLQIIFTAYSDQFTNLSICKLGLSEIHFLHNFYYISCNICKQMKDYYIIIKLLHYCVF